MKQKDSKNYKKILYSLQDPWSVEDFHLDFHSATYHRPVCAFEGLHVFRYYVDLCRQQLKIEKI